MAHAVYREILFVRDVENLWGMIESTNFDWLGVHPDAKFVLGTPRLSRWEVGGGGDLVKAGGDAKRHGVQVLSPGSPSSRTWCATAVDARQEYDRVVAEIEASTRPRLHKVQLLEGQDVIEERYAVAMPPTYGTS